jgi:hypothetical protein
MLSASFRSPHGNFRHRVDIVDLAQLAHKPVGLLIGGLEDSKLRGRPLPNRARRQATEPVFTVVVARQFAAERCHHLHDFVS